MCPPPVPPPTNISKYWTDEEIFISLEKFNNGSPLPSNVTADINPYQIAPSNLPEDIWYWCSDVKENAEHGYWKATGEVCKVFSNSGITGWRTTLEYYEGKSPSGKRTKWVMQEYKITERGTRHKSKPKDSLALYRVFVADVNLSRSRRTTIPVSMSGCGHIFRGKAREKKMDNGARPLAITEKSSDHHHAKSAAGIDYVLRGEYLELDDLADLESGSSSSVDSSCMSYSSEEYFDSSALLRDLDNGTNDRHGRQGENVKFNLSVPAKLNEVIVQPATLGSLVSGKCSARRTPKPDNAKKRVLVAQMKNLKQKLLWFLPL